jgi:hypothetical protein
MRHVLALLAVFVAFASALVLNGTGCMNLVDSDGGISGLSGGDPVDAQLAVQNPPAPPMATSSAACTDAGEPGADCTSSAGVCCGVQPTSTAAATEICFFDGMASGACATEPALGTGITWTELYADYFGGHGRAACSGNGGCHGSTTEPGYASSGYECPPDGDAGKETCYTSIQAVAPSFSTVLRTVINTGGPMPLAPQVYTFSQNDLDRLNSWMEAGAPNN